MSRCNMFRGAALAVALFFITPALATITLGQVDSFQTSDTLGWTVGSNAFFFPTVISTGGPQGANDGYLQLISTGSGKANSRLIMSNSGQWVGDFIDAGVTQITAQIANFGPNPLSMRVAFQDSFGTDCYSTLGIPLPADSQWHVVTFDMTASGLTVMPPGSSPINQALADVGSLRILSSVNGPNFFFGDTIAATVGFDDIAAVPEPALIAPILACVLLRRKRQN
jgi:hypothetical protein